jgi:phospholipid/cholesterol/gamma-HCH transport system substrate-binding protein
MQQNTLVETIIGVAVVLIAAFFLYFAYTRTGTGSLSGYALTAKLPRVDGLGVGTDVRLSGIKIGTISDLTLDPKTYLVIVHMRVRNDIRIPDDSSLVVTSSGLLGSSYLSITPGGSDKMLPPGGEILNTQGSVDLMGMIGRFMQGGAAKASAPPAPGGSP